MGLYAGSSDIEDFIIRVEQIPGKKGVFLKHVEYDVISQRSRVCRRYSDFVVLYDTLMQLYATRVIPRLPPKKALGGDENFLAERQKALERFAMILGKHPIVGRSGLVQHFLTYSGKDLQGSIKEKFKLEEFAGVLPMEYAHVRTLEWTTRQGQIKDQMVNAENSLQKIQNIFENMSLCSKEQVKNHMALNSELSNLCTPTTSPFMEMQNGMPVVRQPFTGILADVASEIAGVTKQWLELANTEDAVFADHLLMLKDLMKGWKDYFTRQTKYASDEQKTVERAIVHRKAEDDKTEEQELGFVESLLGPLMAKFVQTIASSEKRHFGKISAAWQEVEHVARLLSVAPAPSSMVANTPATTPATTPTPVSQTPEATSFF